MTANLTNPDLKRTWDTTFSGIPRKIEPRNYWLDSDFQTRLSQTEPIPTKRLKISPKGENSSILSEKRINFIPAPDDLLFECPYQKSHLILEPRWIRHLCKCRTNYIKECKAQKKEIQIGICKWNNGHHYEIKILAYHEDHCPDQLSEPFKSDTIVIDNDEAHDGYNENIDGLPTKTDRAEGESNFISAEVGMKNLSVHGLNTNEALVDGTKNENWGAERSEIGQNEAAYNPYEAILRQNIPFTKIPSGLTKSEKGSFRARQIARARRRRPLPPAQQDCSVCAEF